MLYDSYHKKISNVVNVLRKIFKHIVLISVVMVLLIASIIAVLVTKGMVLDDDTVSENFEIVYGEPLPLDANALFSKVEYEYSVDGVEWTTEFPSTLGEYMVRAVSTNTLGQQTCGKVYKFSFVAKEIDVSVKDESVTYGENPKISAKLVSGDTITCDKFDFGDRLAQETTITPNADAVKISDVDGKDVTNLYKINVLTTDITIEKRKIIVTVSDKEMIYNNTKLLYDGYELNEATPLAKGDVLQAVFDSNAYIIDVGEKTFVPKLTVVTEDNLDITVHYDIHSSIGSLKVDYRPLIIGTGSSEKIYDDKELFNTEATILGEYDIVEGHTLECESYPSITDVSEIENVLIHKIKDANGEDKTSNYSLFYERGTLSIVPKIIHITTESGTWVYDGELHSADIFMLGFCENHTVKASWPDIIDVGVKHNRVEISSITNQDGREVLHNYEVIHDSVGVLTITKCPITITHETHVNNISDVFYDGTEKSFENYNISGKLADNDTFILTFPTFSQAGTYENENKLLTVEVVSARPTGDVTFEASENYEITEVFGTVVINKCPLVIQAVGATKEYDAEIFAPTDYEIISGSLPANHILNVDYISSLADAGEYAAEIDLSKTNVTFNDEDVTANFDITVQKENLLIITQRPITLEADSVEKVYDGYPLMSDNYSITDGTLIEGHTITRVNFELIEVDVSNDYSLVSRHINNISADGVIIKDADGNEVTKNYNISTISGTLNVLKRNLSITTNSDSKIYDRTPLEGTSLEVDAVSTFNDGLLNGHRIADGYKLAGSAINVGSPAKNQVAEIDIVDENNQSVKDYYIISVNEGDLVILPIEITITTGSDSKVYDGTELTCPEFTSDYAEKLLEGDTVNINVNGTITNVGTVDNTVEFSIFYNGVDMTMDSLYRVNYKITYEYGKLKVTPRPIKITPLPTETEKVYDGTPLECFDYEDSSDYLDASKNEGLLEGHVLGSLYFESLTNVGEIYISLDEYRTVTILDGEENVSDNYEIIVEGGLKFKVNKRNITIESTTAEKEYDGRPLTAPECYLSSGSTLVDGHYIVLSASGSQTEEGESLNTITDIAQILDDYGNDYAENYEITYAPGTLKVTKTVVAKVTSDKEGYVYLKANSYGAYNGQFFGPAPTSTRSFSYNGISNCSYSLWTSATLADSGYISNKLVVTDSIKYLLPYYTVIPGMSSEVMPTLPKYNSEDYTSVSSATEYEVEYFDYSFEKEGLTNLYSYHPGSNYRSYTTWVKNNYLIVDAITKAELLNLVAGKGFENLDVETRIKAVATYIRTSAKYNADYPIGLDSEEDVAVAFFKYYAEGAAKHYATAATMLYRSLDIPARCVEGYIVKTVENETVDVKDAHYWVEVFVEEYGWMQVEVTTGFGGMEDHKTEIIVKPKDDTKIYDGTPIVPTGAELYNPSAELKALFEEYGYTIDAEYKGSQELVGNSPSSVVLNTVRILDANGKDITYKFKITGAEGKLTVNPIPINVFLYENKKTYDGKPLAYDSSQPFYKIYDEAFLSTGYTLSLAITFQRTDVHSITAAELTANSKDYVTFSVMDGENNLSELYCMNFVYMNNSTKPEDYVVAQIKPRGIEIASATVVKDYVEGETLRDSTVIVTKGGPLPEGHVIMAIVNAALDAPGVLENTIDPTSVRILDASANDVTSNFVIDKIVNGTLIYLERDED